MKVFQNPWTVGHSWGAFIVFLGTALYSYAAATSFNSLNPSLDKSVKSVKFVKSIKSVKSGYSSTCPSASLSPGSGSRVKFKEK